jgi:hypothetical protein
MNMIDGVLLFYLKHIGCNSTPIEGIVNEKLCQVYEITVNTMFKDEDAANLFTRWFKL